MTNSNGAGEPMTRFVRAQEKTLFPQMREDRRIKRRVISARWAERNRESINAKMRRHTARAYQQNPNIHKDRHLRRVLKKLGLTVEDYKQILERQGGMCAICQQPEPVNDRLCIDHNHETNTFRALLCTPCNRRLGPIESDPWTKLALSYLQEHQ